FDAIIDVHERARLFAVTPNFDLAAIVRQSDFARHSRRSLLFAAIIRAERAVDVVEAHRIGRQVMIVPVILAHFFGEQFLPSVAGLWVSRIGVFLDQRRYIRVLLLALGIHASRRGEQETLD